ncbi:unnamed protein product [Coregonus sp. 'balchen']|nr:unnamed protein product [Coregonus sp. 'balchen']
MTPLKEDNPGGLVNEDDKDYILDHPEHAGGGKLGERPSTASVQVRSCILRLKGSLWCRAYMNPARTTAKTTTMYTKRDIIRSVYSSAKNVFEHLTNDENSDSEEGMDCTWVPVYKIQQRRKITMALPYGT